MLKQPKQYPAGALVRVRQITSTPDRPGLLPIHASTWWHWVKLGIAPPGKKIGRTTAWHIEDVLALGESAPPSSPKTTKTTKTTKAARTADAAT